MWDPGPRSTFTPDEQHRGSYDRSSRGSLADGASLTWDPGPRLEATQPWQGGAVATQGFNWQRTEHPDRSHEVQPDFAATHAREQVQVSRGSNLVLRRNTHTSINQV